MRVEINYVSLKYGFFVKGWRSSNSFRGVSHNGGRGGGGSFNSSKPVDCLKKRHWNSQNWRFRRGGTFGGLPMSIWLVYLNVKLSA